MCGIFGFIKRSELYVLKERLKNDLITGWKVGSSRGPENSVIQDVSCGLLGFHRLAINGLNPISNQPINKEGCVLICNGEIYNYKNLYKMLNITPKTDSDCEVIIDMYLKYGIDYTLQNLDGVFAFILIDNNNKQVFVARDPFGVRPMYFVNTSLGDCYASEFKQLNFLCNDLNKSDYGQFTPGTYTQYTINNNNSIVKIKENKVYAEFQLQANYSFHNDVKFATHYYQTYYNLCNAVKKRVENTERPIACLLSGGLDSSLIAALVRKFMPKDVKLETYSIGMSGAEDFQYAQMVADHIGSIHTQVVVSEDDFFNAIPNVIYNLSSYDTTTVRASVGNYLIGKYISENSEAKVIFNGDGSDELMGGYMYFHYCKNDMDFDHECKRLLKNIHHFDGLRSDRCISSHGLESRTPFLDRSFVHGYLSIPAYIRNHNNNNEIEKSLLRNAISIYDNKLLPSKVLWRKKEAFSDGVSSQKKSWYEIIQERVEQNELQNIVVNAPSTPEQVYYRTIFENHYKDCGTIIPYFWMPQFCHATDASARTLKIYNEH
jgi:asparagine synthase (glutamine-hydrolysing)